MICLGIREQSMITMLLVAHHELLRQSLRDWLTIGLPQCRVIEATDTTAAIELACNKSVHTIIIDIDIPRENGFEILRSIQASAPNAQIVAFGFDESKIRCTSAIEAGATVYLPKSRMQIELIPTLQTAFGIVNDEH